MQVRALHRQWHRPVHAAGITKARSNRSRLSPGVRYSFPSEEDRFPSIHVFRMYCIMYLNRSHQIHSEYMRDTYPDTIHCKIHWNTCIRNASERLSSEYIAIQWDTFGIHSDTFVSTWRDTCIPNAVPPGSLLANLSAPACVISWVGPQWRSLHPLQPGAEPSLVRQRACHSLDTHVSRMYRVCIAEVVSMNVFQTYRCMYLGRMFGIHAEYI